MNRQGRRWRTGLRVLALALIVAVVPLPCLAGQTGQPAARPALKASITPVVHAVVASTERTPAKSQSQAAGDARAQLESKSFFKTSTGLTVLAVVVAGTGYAFYSIKHDRIQPTGR